MDNERQHRLFKHKQMVAVLSVVEPHPLAFMHVHAATSGTVECRVQLKREHTNLQVGICPVFAFPLSSYFRTVKCLL